MILLAYTFTRSSSFRLMFPNPAQYLEEVRFMWLNCIKRIVRERNVWFSPLCASKEKNKRKPQVFLLKLSIVINMFE